MQLLVLVFLLAAPVFAADPDKARTELGGVELSPDSPLPAPAPSSGPVPKPGGTPDFPKWHFVSYQKPTLSPGPPFCGKQNELIPPVIHHILSCPVHEFATSNQYCHVDDDCSANSKCYTKIEEPTFEIPEEDRKSLSNADLSELTQALQQDKQDYAQWLKSGQDGKLGLCCGKPETRPVVDSCPEGFLDVKAPSDDLLIDGVYACGVEHPLCSEGTCAYAGEAFGRCCVRKDGEVQTGKGE